MEQAAMGCILTEATIVNLKDLWSAEQGRLSPENVRQLTAPDALVDNAVTTLALPTRLIRQLGLAKSYEERARSCGGTAQVSIYEAVRLTIQGRYLTVAVMEVPDDVPVLIGQIPLEMLDLVVDSQAGRLIGNPAHGGEHILELY